ncbi:spore germination protein [Cohnella hongkongensis]|uniref:Spore germination protein n=1 Tax=Cohnella hongkongensis TaxID=178337 RepID=A0ABV9F7F8_9BACL
MTKLHRNSLSERRRQLEQRLGESADLIVRECSIGQEAVPALLMWIDSIVDKRTLQLTTLTPLLSLHGMPEAGKARSEGLDFLCRSVITAPETKLVRSEDDAIPLLLDGWTALLLDGAPDIAAIQTRGLEKRGIEEAPSSTVVRGPRDGFVESLDVNVSLVRRRIRSENVRVDKLKAGSVSHTDIAIMYIHQIAKPAMVEEVKSRVRKLQIDGVLESQYVEELVKDSPASIFPTVYSTERPDDIAGILLEGRIAILVDGSPFALALPCTLAHLLKTTEDLYLAYPVATFIRWLRYVGCLMNLLLPSVYVGTLTFHPEMVPPQLLSSILTAREGVPFPVLLETLLMEVTFEVLREASVRMPRTIGSAISIVGALVIGESAVQAGIISSPAIIVVAATAIASFTIPSTSLSGTVRILRFGMVLLASMFGLYGIMIGLFLLGIHLASLKSLGVPYLAPFAPFRKKQFIKFAVRIPWFIQNRNRK